ncbi:unnamed protein product [Victoria cruziana]
MNYCCKQDKGKVSRGYAG